MESKEKINILFFVENLNQGGAEKVLRNLVNNMDLTQFNITVQTAWPCDASQYLAPGIRYKSMYSSESKANLLRYRIEAEIGLAYVLHIKDDYDIECAYLEMGSTKVMAESTNKKAKKLAWVHCDLKKKMRDTEAFVKKTAGWYRKFDRVICVSKAVRESFIDLFGNRPESMVLYNTIDDTEILSKADGRLTVQKTKLTALAIGRFTQQKGFDRLLEACQRLKQDGADFALWILGDGPERTALEKSVELYNLKDYVKLLGFQPNPYPFIKQCDFYVCSSRYEGMSTTTIEAMILGKPIITTDCTGMRELLGDSEFGLIKANSTDGLFEGLKQMISDPTLRDSLAKASSERGKMFRASELAKLTEEYFVTLMNN